MKDLRDTDGLYSIECRCCGDRLARETVLDLWIAAHTLGWADERGGATCKDCKDCIHPIEEADEEDDEDWDCDPCEVCGGEVADSEGDEWEGKPVHFSCARDNGIPTYLDPNPEMKLEVGE